MKILKAYKFRIYPNNEQKEIFERTFGCVRFIYNKMLSDKIEHYKNTQKTLKNTPAQYKVEFPWLKEVDSLALSNAQLNLQRAYQKFFTKQNKFPRFKAKRNRQSYTTNSQKGTVRIVDGKLKLPKQAGLIKIIMERQLPNNSIIKNATITKTPTNKYFVSLIFERDITIPKVEVNNENQVIGLDFSMPRFYYGSDGEIGEYPKFFRKHERKLAKAQRKMSKMRKSGQNFKKQRLVVAKIHEKITNCRKDFLHKKSHDLLNRYDCVVIENLNMQNMSQALHFGKSTMDNGWGMFVEQLKYKATEQGKSIITADKWFASSKTCNNCGHKKDKLSLKERTYTCEKCGFVINRDMNAALNLRDYGLKELGI